MGDFNWNGFLPEMFGLAGAGSAMNGQAQGLPGTMEALGLGQFVSPRPEPEKPKRPEVEILPPIQPRKIRFE